MLQLSRVHPTLLLLLLLLTLVGCRFSSDESAASRALPRQTATLAPTRAPSLPESTPSTTAVPSPALSPTPTLPPPERLSAAREAERIGEWERAFDLYESLRADPEVGAEALFYLGDLYLRDERPIEAAAAWREALLREPTHPRAPALQYRLARGLNAIGQHQAAIELWQQVDEAMDDADVLLARRLADAHEALGERAAARAELIRLYELPGAARVERARAANRVAQGFAAEERWGEALQWYENTLALSEIHTFRAELIATMADIAEQIDDEGYAQNQWRLLVEEYPDTPQALDAAARLGERDSPLSLFERGKLLAANGQWRQAAQSFFESLEEEEDRAEAHEQAALALEELGEWTAARDEWQKLLDTHPEAEHLLPDALLGLGRAQARLGERAVLDTWGRVVDEFSGTPAAATALWERARFLQEEGRDPRAVAFAFESLARAHPDDERAEEALWEAAMLRLRAEQLGRARDNWEAMAELGGERAAEALYWAGKAALQAGDEQAAERLWQRAMDLPEASFYSLRARARLEGQEWLVRQESTVVSPSVSADSDLEWLREAGGVDKAEPIPMAPAEPLFRQGEAMLLLGERDSAISTLLDAIVSREEEPLELWAMAQRLRDLELPNLSIFAAFRLMALLGYDVLSAPPELAVLAFPIPYEEQLLAAAAQWEVDPLFFASVIHQESAWEPRARSVAAARGLTQVIPDTGEWIAWRLGDDEYEYRKLDRPLYSLRYGGYYLDYVLDTFDDNPFYALAAYNAGPGNAQRWHAEDVDFFVERVTSAETRSYLEEIYRRWHAYQRLYRDGREP